MARTYLDIFNAAEPAAQALLHRLSWFAQSPIPSFVLGRTPERRGAVDETPSGALLTALEQDGMVKWSSDHSSFSIEPTFQSLPRTLIVPGTLVPDSLMEALHWLNHTIPRGPQTPRAREQWQALAPHVEVVTREGVTRNVSEPTAHLLAELGSFRLNEGNAAAAEEHLRAGLRLQSSKTTRGFAALATGIAGLLAMTGRVSEAELLLNEVGSSEGGMDDAKAATLFNLAGLLLQQGKLGEAEAICRDQLLPYLTAQGEVGLQRRAVTLGQIADILSDRGELDEALRIRREEQLPVFEKLGDVRSRAVTLGKIADILSARGELDEALRIRREEELPVYEKLGDVRSHAVTMGKIADIFSARGELDEALRIRREEELPVYKQLGDVRSRAVTARKVADILEARGDLDEAERMLRDEALKPIRGKGMARDEAVFLGRIADILSDRGELDEALHIRREEVLPVYEKLGDVRELIVGRAMVAQMLAIRGNKEDRLEVETHLAWAWREARRMGLPEAGQIEEIAERIGLPVEVLAQVAEKV